MAFDDQHSRFDTGLNVFVMNHGAACAEMAMPKGQRRGGEEGDMKKANSFSMNQVAEDLDVWANLVAALKIKVAAAKAAINMVKPDKPECPEGD